MDTTVLDWEDIDKACNVIAKWARLHGIKQVYGIPRGGIIPAALVARRIGAPLVFVADKLSSCLIVDDIADTGDTIIKHNLTGCYVATICYKKQSKVRPNVVCRVVPDDVWVIFPWEFRDNEPIGKNTVSE